MIGRWHSLVWLVVATGAVHSEVLPKQGHEILGFALRLTVQMRCIDCTAGWVTTSVSSSRKARPFNRSVAAISRRSCSRRKAIRSHSSRAWPVPTRT